MEVLIIASLSFIGYELARKKSLTVNKKQPTLSKIPMKAKKEIQKMNSPLISQNQPVPFFRSEKSQNTNDICREHDESIKWKFQNKLGSDSGRQAIQKVLCNNTGATR